MNIKRLPEEVINQIAAGEVVQSPSAVLKELLENALDSGASRISIDYIDAGMHSLRITDDGHGINASDLPLVATRFATSKLRSACDLNKISTFGFRGEALAALSYVSFLQVITRGNDLCNTPNCHLAKYRRNLLESSDIVTREDFPFGTQCKGKTGTAVVVENLFYNNATRRSVFSARKYEEMNKMEEIVKKYAIANPGVAYSLIRSELPKLGGRSSPVWRFSVSGNCENMGDVMRSLYGNAFMKHMVSIDKRNNNDQPSLRARNRHSHDLQTKSEDNIFIGGIASDPYYTHPKSKQIVCFVNKRLVHVPSCLRKVIERFYQQILPKKHHPYVFLVLHVPANSVEVNIHPTKSEVRIMYEERCCAILEERLNNSILVCLHDRVMETIPQQNPVSDKKRERNLGSEPIVKISPQHLNRSLRDIGQMEKYVIHSPTQERGQELRIICGEENSPTMTKFNTDMKRDRIADENSPDIAQIEKIAKTKLLVDIPLPKHTIEPFHPRIESITHDHDSSRNQHMISTSLTIKDPLNKNVKKRRGNEELLLSSIQTIITSFRKEETIEVRDVILGGTYVGCIASFEQSKSVCRIFLQHQTSLYMLDGELLLTNAAFQNIFWFWERQCWYSLMFSPGIPLNHLLGDARSEESPNNLLSDILSAHTEMLDAYFGIGIIGSENRLTKLPLLLGRDYLPCVAGITVVLAQIAHTIASETDEKKCLISIASALAQWFAYRPGTRRGIQKNSDAHFSVEIPIVPPSDLTYDVSLDKKATRKVLDGLAPCSFDRANRHSQEEHDYTLHHGGISCIQKLGCYSPPLSLWRPQSIPVRSTEGAKDREGIGREEDPIICIATTEALYKVFERC